MNEHDAIDTAFYKARRFKVMAKNMTMMINWPPRDAMERASGLCLCDKCGLEYFDHPEKNGLVLTCDGRLLHL